MAKIPRKKIIISVLFVAVLVIAALPKIKPAFNRSNAPTGGAAPDQRLPVKVHVVRPDTLYEKIFTTGTLVANEEVELRSEVSGKIVKIYFQEGSRVSKGDLLVKINDAEMQAQLQRELSRKELAEKAEQRQRQLFERALISQEAYDAAKNELNSVNASIQLIKAQIDKTEIRAPFEGLIGLKYVSDGSYITPTTRIATLQDTHPIKIDFSIPEKYANVVRKNMSVIFKVQGLDRVYEGMVYAIEPKVEQATRTVLLRATSPNPNGELFPGSFAEVELILQRIDNALTIPSEALIPDIAGQRVFIARDGLAQTQRVQTGIRTATTVQITDGVKAGDSVITSGILQLRSGMPVQIAQVE
ncbi:MAG TPA: efflux RND transporter periplasmic adaptor subunit [Bacteroidota bacterium]|nr:efflux RND transporter periplasmic adaptor subunit [Bacteroidota bacterium]